MKLVIAMNLPYYPTHGGANKSNRIVAELLAACGHEVHVVAPALGVPARIGLDELRTSLSRQGTRLNDSADVYQFEISGVQLHAVVDRSRLSETLAGCVRSTNAHRVIVSSEDPSHSLLQSALIHAPDRIAYMLLTPSFLPFGPLAFFPGPKRTVLFEQVPYIVATSQFSADYVTKWSSARASVCHLPVYGEGPFPNYGSPNREFVTLVNPCRYKGIDILTSLAATLPDVRFAAVPAWGTTSADLGRLHALPNVTVLPACDDIDDILRRTRILLMPSLWLENFPLTVIEAMLRGIPVLAADVGGLPEAKLGTRFLLPVRPIERYTSDLDENYLPVAVVSEQNIKPWREALASLVDDRELYARESAASRAAAMQFVNSLKIEHLESVLSIPSLAVRE